MNVRILVPVAAALSLIAAPAMAATGTSHHRVRTHTVKPRPAKPAAARRTAARTTPAKPAGN